MTLWIFDNLDSTQMPSELQEESGKSSHLLDNDIPNAVLEMLENFSFEMFSFKPETVNKYIVPLYLTRY